jgi:hypothetical protein
MAFDLPPPLLVINPFRHHFTTSLLPVFTRPLLTRLVDDTIVRKVKAGQRNRKGAERRSAERRAPMKGGRLQRLGVLTAIALLIAFAFRPQGFTVLIGLAVFQLLMMGSTAGAMVRQLRG